MNGRRKSLSVLCLILSGWIGLAAAADVEQKAKEIEAKLMSPCCMSGTVADHGSAIAYQMKDEIRAMLNDGQTEREILDHYVAQHGPQILSMPRARGFNLTAYLLPVLLFLLGAVGVVLAVRRWQSREHPVPAVETGGAPSAPLDPEYAERLQRELRKLD
jgi:cytochrome c-type biogenesis protein CcmH